MAVRDPFGLVGAVIADKYRVERVLGEGGYGVVYAGTHLVVGEPVAIKCLKPSGVSADERARASEAFLREARILFGLGHPSIVRLYDAGVIPRAEVPYAVLELVVGRTLADEIAERAKAQRALSADELVAIFVPVLEAVGFAHERGVVHRDLKPTNVMLVAGGSRVTPKVLDFGTARVDVAGTGRAADASVGLGATGFTPLYAAPEQWDAAYGPTGPRTDVYALGLTILEACLLAYPFDTAGGMMAILRAALDERARPALSEARPDLPPDLERVVLRAMRVRPEERFVDARELAASFRTALKASVITAPLARPLPSAPPRPPGVAYDPTQLATPRGISAPPPARDAPTGPPRAPAATPPPPAPPYAPPSGGLAVLGTTTRPQALPAEPQPASSSAVPWAVGCGALAVAAIAAAVGVIAVMRASAEAPSPAAPRAPTSTDAPAHDAPSSAPSSPAPSAHPGGAPSHAPAPPRDRPPAARDAGPAPQLVLAGVTGQAPFWSTADVLGVARAHHADMIGCAREGREVDPKAFGDVSLIVKADETGAVGDVMCSLTGGGRAEPAMCGCAQAVVGRWRFPPAHGKLGGLRSAPFILDYRLLEP